MSQIGMLYVSEHQSDRIGGQDCICGQKHNNMKQMPFCVDQGLYTLHKVVSCEQWHDAHCVQLNIHVMNVMTSLRITMVSMMSSLLEGQQINATINSYITAT